jgi:outer membrane receptor protein involved in Fe transport
LLDVPLSVHVITSREIELSGARNFRDFANAVAGVTFSDVGLADAKVTIRGVSTDVYSEIRPLTATYLDEVPVTHPGTHLIVQSDANPELVDVERIEILRGPQGTLYGASSMGGTIRVVTSKPDPASVAGFVETTVSSTDHGGPNYGIDLVGNLPLTREGALRLVGYYRDAEGFIDNVGTGADNANSVRTYGGRLAFRKIVSDRLNILATVNYQRQHADGLNLQHVSLPRYQQDTFVDQSWDDEWTLPSLVITFDLGQVELLSSTAWINRKWHAIGDVTGWQRTFDLGPSVPITSVPITSDHTQELGEFFQEFRFASSDGKRFDWLVGLFLNDRNQRWNSSFPAPGFDEQSGGVAADAGVPDNIGIGQTDFDHEQIAIFGEIGIPFAQRFRLDIGSRWYWFDERHRGAYVDIFGGDGVPQLTSADTNGMVPKFTLSWRPTDESLIYATASRGFRPGGPNGEPEAGRCDDELAAIGLTRVPNPYKSDSLWSYELGGRATWLNGRVRASASAYHIDWTDIQIFLFFACGQFMSNGGGAESNGAELELTLLPRDSLEVAFGATYIDAALTDDAYNGAPAGSPLPGVPNMSWYATVYGDTQFGEDRTLFARTAIRFVGESYGGFARTFPSPAYEIVDLRIGLETRTWAVSLFADNLLDEYGIVNTVDDFGLHIAGDWRNLIRPRTIGLDVRVNFD